jgi:hypothetical protein
MRYPKNIIPHLVIPKRSNLSAIKETSDLSENSPKEIHCGPETSQSIQDMAEGSPEHVLRYAQQ